MDKNKPVVIHHIDTPHVDTNHPVEIVHTGGPPRKLRKERAGG